MPRRRSAVFQDGVEKIDKFSFYDCPRLETLVIPASMGLVDECAFILSDNVRDVYYLGPESRWSLVSADNLALQAATVHYGLPTFRVAYNANGGSGAPPAQMKAVGQVLPLSTAVPRRSGWYFLGWALSADAADAEYRPGGSFGPEMDATLYAVWARPDLALPAALTRVEEEAFANCSFRFAALSEKTVELQSGAFAGCENLRYIYIPAACTAIDADALSGTDGACILGVSGSAAETFARQQNLDFIPAKP